MTHSTQMALFPAALINTPLQRGDWRVRGGRNRFNGLGGRVETVETVFPGLTPEVTPLKRGVNETSEANDQMSSRQRRTL
jgi:hypothetical protein